MSKYDGCEKLALDACISLYTQCTGFSRAQAEELLDREISNNLPRLSLSDIEKKNFTYVTVTRRSDNGDESVWEKFLVATPERKLALTIAKRYTAERGWDLLPNTGTAYLHQCTCCRCYTFYPRNYVREAKKLCNQGKYY